MQWLRVTVDTTSECADIVSVILMEAGSEGVSVSDINDVKEVLRDKNSWDYADEELLKKNNGEVDVIGFFGKDFEIESLKHSLDVFRENSAFPTGSLSVRVDSVKDSDWANEWRKYYHPIERENVAIVPCWLKYGGNCDIKVFIDPGMAFGTGRHETTAMCVSLLQKIDLNSKIVLDIGCGSGILGISALKCGAKHCVMSDIDSNAIISARENSQLNGVSESAEFVCGNLNLSENRYDVVLANLTADILLRLFETLPEAVNSGGYVVISGLIHERADEVLQKYSEKFKLVERLCEGEWQAMLLNKE